jgi:hypothetical protein
MKIEDFIEVLDFPMSTRIGVVYVFFWVAGGVRTPFYVGQTGRFLPRMEDYCAADFAASTDFKVGEAAKYLKNTMNYDVVVGYRLSADPCKDESEIICELRIKRVRLLNDLPGYDYRTADINDQKKEVQKFCDDLRPVFSGEIDSLPTL